MGEVHFSGSMICLFRKRGLPFSLDGRKSGKGRAE
jgi:hypothetical protein